MKKLLNLIATTIAKRPRIKQFVVRLTKRAGLHERLKSFFLLHQGFDGSGTSPHAALPQASQDSGLILTARSRRVYADLIEEVKKINSEKA